MINLLSSEKKEALLSAKNKKLFGIIVFLFCFFVFSFSMILISVRFYITGETDALKNTLSQMENKSNLNEAKNLQQEITSFNALLTEFNAFYAKKINFPEVLANISNNFTSGIYLKNFNINMAPDETFNISGTGFAPNRESLFELKKNLEKNTDFSEIYFPPENWVKPENIDFSFTFKFGKPKNEIK